jgi:hypothetical protein
MGFTLHRIRDTALLRHKADRESARVKAGGEIDRAREMTVD